MRTKGVVGGFFLLILLFTAAGYATVMTMSASSAAPAVAEAAVADDDVCTADLQPADGGSMVSVAKTEAACARCPSGTPSCSSDKQCDNFCGGKGFGDCVQINSCYKCCYCAL